MLGPLGHVTRVPRQFVAALVATSDLARQLPELRHVVTKRLGALDRGVGDVVVLLPAIARDLERVRATVEPQHLRVAAMERSLARVDARVGELHLVVERLDTEVRDAAELLPDPDAPGPVARVRDALTGRTDPATRTPARSRPEDRGRPGRRALRAAVTPGPPASS